MGIIATNNYQQLEPTTTAHSRYGLDCALVAHGPAENGPTLVGKTESGHLAIVPQLKKNCVFEFS